MKRKPNGDENDRTTKKLKKEQQPVASRPSLTDLPPDVLFGETLLGDAVDKLVLSMVCKPFSTLVDALFPKKIKGPVWCAKGPFYVYDMIEKGYVDLVKWIMPLVNAAFACGVPPRRNPDYVKREDDWDDVGRCRDKHWRNAWIAAAKGKGERTVAMLDYLEALRNEEKESGDRLSDYWASPYPRPSREAIRTAAATGRTDALKWFKDKECEGRFSYRRTKGDESYDMGDSYWDNAMRRSLFVEACENGRTDVLDHLIAHGDSLAHWDEYGSALSEGYRLAAENGHLSVIQRTIVHHRQRQEQHFAGRGVSTFVGLVGLGVSTYAGIEHAYVGALNGRRTEILDWCKALFSNCRSNPLALQTERDVQTKRERLELRNQLASPAWLIFHTLASAMPFDWKIKTVEELRGNDNGDDVWIRASAWMHLLSALAKSGDEETLVWAMKKGLGWQKGDCGRCASASLDALKLALKRDCPWDRGCLRKAALKGRSDVLEWFEKEHEEGRLREGPEGPEERWNVFDMDVFDIDDVYRMQTKGHFSCARWFLRHDYPLRVDPEDKSSARVHKEDAEESYVNVKKVNEKWFEYKEQLHLTLASFDDKNKL